MEKDLAVSMLQYRELVNYNVVYLKCQKPMLKK